MRDTVVITASAGTFPGLAAALKGIPVAVEESPLLSFGPPLDWSPLDRALEQLSEYGTLVFTSPRAAQTFAERMKSRGVAWNSGRASPAVWAAGPATAAALHGALGSVRLPVGRSTGKMGAAKALARAMLEEEAAGPVLFPCGESHRDELPAELRSGSITVEEIVCYRSVLASVPEARSAASRASVLVVASPSVAGLLARACPRSPRPELLAVGPTTADSARAEGWPPAEVASEPTVRALASAIRSLVARR
jgi:uroporphyrinogen III methyltransferase / synthase